MEVYFYDDNMRYIGHRTLKDGESMPMNATAKPVIKADGQEAYFIDNEWDIRNMPVEVLPSVKTAPTLEQLAVAIVEAQVAIMELSLE